MFRRYSGWNEMERLRRDIDRLVDLSLPRVYGQRARTFPAINIWKNDEEGVIVTAELSGVNADDIDISVTADTLTIAGTRQPLEEPNKERYHRQELTYGDFSRAIQLPCTVNNQGVEASVTNGVLRIFLPRAEAEKPKKIAVAAGS